MKRSRPTEVIYRRPGTVQKPKLICNNCKSELPHAKKPQNIRSVHLTCGKCGHTIILGSEKKT